MEYVCSQGNAIAFYRRFLESPNFAAWFERQRGVAWAWQESEWAAAAAVRGEGTDLSGLDEVQVCCLLGTRMSLHVVVHNRRPVVARCEVNLLLKMKPG